MKDVFNQGEYVHKGEKGTVTIHIPKPVSSQEFKSLYERICR